MHLDGGFIYFGLDFFLGLIPIFVSLFVPCHVEVMFLYGAYVLLESRFLIYFKWCAYAVYMYKVPDPLT